MTPQDVNTAARDIYNAVGDSFFTDTQIWNWIWEAERILARRTWCIEGLNSTGAITTTTAGTQGYAFPTRALAIKRITVNGRKLKRVTQRDDDALTLSNQAVTTQGWPIYYTEWNNTVYLRPIPDASNYTINWYTYDDPTQVTSGTTNLDVPSVFHFDLVDYVLMRMFAKDKDAMNMAFHRDEWNSHIVDAKAFMKRMKRADSFATVQSEETLPITIIGEV